MEQYVALNRKYLVVVIYDISNDKRRSKLGKFLSGFGIRVQNSAFECYIDEKTYKKLSEKIKYYIRKEDLIKIYKIDVNARVISQGLDPEKEIAEVIII